MKNVKGLTKGVFIHTTLIIASLLSIFPFLWLISTALTTYLGEFYWRVETNTISSLFCKQYDSCWFYSGFKFDIECVGGISFG